MNKSGYEDHEIASYYAKQSDLQPPEEAILSVLVNALAGKRMLDIGVGGGRTTLHFAKWTADYVGVDYSAAMISGCRLRFAAFPGNMTFVEGDATQLTSFPDDSFDFVLFSFNGIDYVSHEARLEVFREVHRIGRPGGHFVFSTHNLQAAPKLFSLRRQFCLHPLRLLRQLKRWFLLTFVHNRWTTVRSLGTSNHSVFNDGAHGYRFQTYYITPTAQIEQLRSGFGNVRVFALSDGRELTGDAQLRTVEDSWLYFLGSIIK